jgi:hypothetical protein
MMMSTPIVTNPTTFTITDPAGVTDSVTSFDVDFGRATGAYTLTASVPLANVTVDTTANTYTGKIADLHEQLGAGQWFAASRAVNANGISTESPEATFTIVPPPPSAPTGFTVA